MPAVAIGAKLADATKHPQYAAAKAGDQVAALELVRISAIVDRCFSLIVHGETASARKRWGVRKHQVGM